MSSLSRGTDGSWADMFDVIDISQIITSRVYNLLIFCKSTGT